MRWNLLKNDMDSDHQDKPKKSKEKEYVDKDPY